MPIRHNVDYADVSASQGFARQGLLVSCPWEARVGQYRRDFESRSGGWDIARATLQPRVAKRATYSTSASSNWAAGAPDAVADESGLAGTLLAALACRSGRRSSAVQKPS